MCDSRARLISFMLTSEKSCSRDVERPSCGGTYVHTDGDYFLFSNAKSLAKIRS